MPCPGRDHRRLPALSILLAMVAAGLIAAGPAVARSAHASGTTVTVVEHANTDTEVPLAPGGKDEKGDILTFVNPVFNAADTRQVGHDEGFCTRLDPKKGVWECLWTTFLKRGQITVQGPFYDTRNSTLSITGGTGAYRNDRGQMKLKSLDGGKKYDFVFELR
jgi:allene oxide cyclase